MGSTGVSSASCLQLRRDSVLSHRAVTFCDATDFYYCLRVYLKGL